MKYALDLSYKTDRLLTETHTYLFDSIKELRSARSAIECECNFGISLDLNLCLHYENDMTNVVPKYVMVKDITSLEVREVIE